MSASWTIEPVGHYAIRIQFDDMHDTGIFSWRYLYDLGRDQDQIWQGYLDALASSTASAATRVRRKRLQRTITAAGAVSGGCGHKH